MRTMLTLARQYEIMASAFAYETGQLVSLRQLAVLVTLRENPDSTHSALAIATQIPPRTLTDTVEALRKKGWVFHKRPQSARVDRRCIRLGLTKNGETALVHIEQHAVRAESAALGKLKSAA